MSIGLRERLLEEIYRRLEDHARPCEQCNHAQALRALRREVERHHVNPMSGDQKFCACCEAQDGKAPEGWVKWAWPCPSIVDIAKELRVANLPEEKP